MTVLLYFYDYDSWVITASLRNLHCDALFDLFQNYLPTTPPPLTTDQPLPTASPFQSLLTIALAVLGALRAQLRGDNDDDELFQLVQFFLDEKAVQGHDCFVSKQHLSPRQEENVRVLEHHGWVILIPGKNDEWQLSLKSLKLINVQIALEKPMSVFQRRDNIPLSALTLFELTIAARANGWVQQEKPHAIGRAALPPFVAGFFFALVL